MHSEIPRIARAIGRLAWPVLVAQQAVIASGVLDTVMAGRYGAVDLAAVGIGASVYFSIFIGLTGVLQALSPVAAQLFGAQRYGEIGEATRQTAWMAAGLAVIGIFLLGFPDSFLQLLGAPPEVALRARAYLVGIAWATPAMLLFRVFFSLTTAVSRPRAVMFTNLVYLALKVPLNAMFIYGAFGAPELGGPGCAVATAIASWTTCFIAWIYCGTRPFYKPFGVFARWSWPDPHAIGTLLRLGVPIGLTSFVEVTSFTFIALFVARLGAATSAGHQIASNMVGIVYMFGIAVGTATGVLTAQAVGARDSRKARQTGFAGMMIMVAVSASLGAAVLLGAPAIAQAYTKDAAVQKLAAQLLVFVVFYELFDTLQVVIVNALRGYKIAVVPMLVYTVALWGIGLGGGYALGLTRLAGADILGLATPMGVTGFWLAGVASLVVSSLILLAYFAWISRPTRLAE